MFTHLCMSIRGRGSGGAGVPDITAGIIAATGTAAGMVADTGIDYGSAILVRVLAAVGLVGSKLLKSFTVGLKSEPVEAGKMGG